MAHQCRDLKLGFVYITIALLTQARARACLGRLVLFRAYGQAREVPINCAVPSHIVLASETSFV